MAPGLLPRCPRPPWRLLPPPPPRGPRRGRGLLARRTRLFPPRGRSRAAAGGPLRVDGEVGRVNVAVLRADRASLAPPPVRERGQPNAAAATEPGVGPGGLRQEFRRCCWPSRRSTCSPTVPWS